MHGELDVIDRIRRVFPRFEGGVGIGDDAALVEIAGPVVVTTDILIDGIDFSPAVPIELVAGRSLVANLSDLAAMGAEPVGFLLTLGMPHDFLSSLDRFLGGLAATAKQYRIDLIGGDLSEAGALTISITALGRLAHPEHPLLRSGARAGQRIFVSRPLGGSAAGLGLLERGWSVDSRGGVAPPPESHDRFHFEHTELAASAILRHVAPEPELALGSALAAIPEITACIDISDGLSTDLWHVCRASGVGAILEWERIPILPDLERLGFSLGIEVPGCALHGGEEFSLLFTTTLREAELSSRLGRPVYAIGRTTAEPGVLLERHGAAAPLEPAGYEHFKSDPS